jgi:hypothetical protein
MSQNEMKTKLRKTKNGLAVVLSPEFMEDTLLDAGMEVSVTKKGPNKFLMRILDLEEKHLPCQICGQHQGKHTCTICGSLACVNCFWELGMLCKKCMKMK